MVSERSEQRAKRVRMSEANEWRAKFKLKNFFNLNYFSTMAAEEILSIGEENLNAESLENLLKFKNEIIAYDGFEPSNRIIIV